MRCAKGRVGVRKFLVAAVLFAAPAVWAQAKVDVSADVVLASNNGSTIDPPELAKMKDQFMKSGLAFTSSNTSPGDANTLHSRAKSDVGGGAGAVGGASIDGGV